MRTAAAVSALVLGLLAAGCSTDETEPSTLPPVPLPSTSYRDGSSTRPTAAGPSDSAGTTKLTVPTQTAGVTPAAASAFTKHFFGVINDAYLQRSAQPVRELSSQECGSCAAVIADISRLSAANSRVAGRRYILSAAEAAPPLPNGRVVVDFRFTADAYVERDPQGRMVQRFPAEDARDGQVMLEPIAGSWRVTAIRLLDE